MIENNPDNNKRPEELKKKLDVLFRAVYGLDYLVSKNYKELQAEVDVYLDIMETLDSRDNINKIGVERTIEKVTEVIESAKGILIREGVSPLELSTEKLCISYAFMEASNADFEARNNSGALGYVRPELLRKLPKGPHLN